MQLLRRLLTSYANQHRSNDSHQHNVAVISSISPRPLPREQLFRLPRKGALEDEILHRYLQGS